MVRGPGKGLSIETTRDDDGRILVPCRIGGLYGMHMLLNTARPLSYLSLATYRALQILGYCDHIGGRIYRVHEVEMGGEPVNDLIVRTSAALPLLGCEAMLGLQFLDQFSEIHFTAASGLLTLTF